MCAQDQDRRVPSSGSTFTGCLRGPDSIRDKCDRQGVRAIGEAEAMAMRTLDSLSANIALLDAQGNIVAVNRAWRRFAEHNSPVSCPVRDTVAYTSAVASTMGSVTRMTVPRPG